MTVSLLSPSSTVQEPLESLADAPVQPVTRNQPNPWDEVNETVSATSCNSSLISCAAEPTTPAYKTLDTDFTDVTTSDSAQDPFVTNQQHSETPHTNGLQIHTVKASGNITICENTDLLEEFEGSQRTSLNQSEESSKRKRSPSACLSYPPPPLVIVSVPSRPVSLLRKSTRLRTRPNSDCLQFSDSIAGDTCESDSAASDDENDADYSNSSMMKTEVKSCRPAKRRRRVPDKVSSTSRVPRRSFSKSPSAKLPESPLEDLDAESEPIPIQGFLRLRYSGPEVIYCVEFSQADLLSSVAARQIVPAQPHQQTTRPTAKIPYTPEEDAYIMELKAQKIRWGEIETLFAQKFPHRKKSCLAVHYCKLIGPKPSLKRSRKRRVKSRV